MWFDPPDPVTLEHVSEELERVSNIKKKARKLREEEAEGKGRGKGKKQNSLAD